MTSSHITAQVCRRKYAAVLPLVGYLFRNPWKSSVGQSYLNSSHVHGEAVLDSVFNKLPVFMPQWEKEKAVLYLVEVLPPIADSFHVATMARKQHVKFTRN
jgi:hypothetical protein